MDSEEPDYQLIYHEFGRETLEIAIERLLKAGWSKRDIATVVRTYERRLRKDPHGFGEPHFSVRAVNLKVSVGFVRPLSIEIGIAEDQRVVFVRRVTVMTTDKN
jgi:hypothetical protein